jgi:uncharacterized SAM-binding protein YcdF (DUF218 family)
MTRWFHRLFTLFAILLAVWAIGLFRFIGEIPAMPQTNPAKTDAVVVLTGGDQRLQRGLELLNAGIARKLLISGVGKGATLDKLLARYPGSDLGNIATPNDVIILDDVADTTFTNAIETRRWMEKEGYRSLRVVTGNYHLPRSLLIFVHYMPDYLIIPEPVFPKDFQRRDWWRTPNSLRLVLVEYNKFLLTWLRLKTGDL